MEFPDNDSRRIDMTCDHNPKIKLHLYFNIRLQSDDFQSDITLLLLNKLTYA